MMAVVAAAMLMRKKSHSSSGTVVTYVKWFHTLRTCYPNADRLGTESRSHFPMMFTQSCTGGVVAHCCWTLTSKARRSFTASKEKT